MTLIMGHWEAWDHYQVDLGLEVGSKLLWDLFRASVDVITSLGNGLANECVTWAVHVVTRHYGCLP